MGPVLGAGASGTVCLARDELSGQLYAVKRFKKVGLGSNAGRKVLRYLERERDVLRLMATTERGDVHRCRWVIHMVACGQTAHELQVVMPACLAGELWQLLDELGAMGDAQLRFYAACLVLALSRLHAHGVVYRDLKPENVLITADGWPVVADVGLAAFVVDERPLFSVCGTPEYMAPEIIAHARGYGFAADWWSLGVLLSQCLTLTTPFRDAQGRPKQIFENVYTGRVTAPPTLHYRYHGGKHAVALIDALLARDTGRRLCGDALRLHPFFWGLDWAALQRRQLAPPHAAYAAERAREVRRAFAAWERENPAGTEGAGADGADAAASQRDSASLQSQGWESVPGW